MGVPVALLGLVFFVVTLAPHPAARVASAGALARRGPPRLADRSASGMALYLVWAELYRVHAICLWCTAVHVVTFLLWIVVLFGQILSAPAEDARRRTEPARPQSKRLMTGISSVSTPSTAFSSGLAGRTVAT